MHVVHHINSCALPHHSFRPGLTAVVWAAYLLVVASLTAKDIEELKSPPEGVR